MTPEPGAVRHRLEDRHLPFLDLVDRVVIHAAHDPKRYQRVRAAMAVVQPWFNRYCGWGVQVHQDFIRLIKSPDHPRAGHGLLAERSLTAREYAMLTWVLWYGEHSNADQFAVTQLAKEIQERSATVVAPNYIDWTVREHRAALRVALQTLEHLNLITLIDGDLRPYVDEATGDALYEYSAAASHLPVLLTDAAWREIVLERNLSAIDTVPDHDATLEIRTYRALLLTTGITMEQPDLLQYATQHRLQVTENLREHFGWALEVGPAHVAIVRRVPDPRGRTTFPGLTADMAIPLLVANAIRDEVAGGVLRPDQATDIIAVSADHLAAVLGAVRREYRDSWSAEMAALEVPALLERFLAIGLTWGVVSGPDAVGDYHLLPMLGRYAGTYRDDHVGIGQPHAHETGREEPQTDDEDEALVS